MNSSFEHISKVMLANRDAVKVTRGTMKSGYYIRLYNGNLMKVLTVYKSMVIDYTVQSDILDFSYGNSSRFDVSSKTVEGDMSEDMENFEAKLSEIDTQSILSTDYSNWSTEEPTPIPVPEPEALPLTGEPSYIGNSWKFWRN